MTADEFDEHLRTKRAEYEKLAHEDEGFWTRDTGWKYILAAAIGATLMAASLGVLGLIFGRFFERLLP
jgi:hypothetical protein